MAPVSRRWEIHWMAKQLLFGRLSQRQPAGQFLTHFTDCLTLNPAIEATLCLERQDITRFWGHPSGHVIYQPKPEFFSQYRLEIEAVEP